MGFSVMLRGAEKLVPVEYWCPYGTKSKSEHSTYAFMFDPRVKTLFDCSVMVWQIFLPV